MVFSHAFDEPAKALDESANMQAEASIIFLSPSGFSLVANEHQSESFLIGCAG